MSFGSRDAALVMAAWTSWAAASMFRSRVNVSVICVNPRPLLDTMESSPAIVVNWRSRGVATEDAIVSGLAPGRFAVTRIVGKSTLGGSLTGRRWDAREVGRAAWRGR